mgnify:CR=1 FL=1
MSVVLIFVSELILLIALIQGLHFLSPRIGLLPMLFVVMTIVTLVAVSVYINVFITTPRIRFNVNGQIFVPVIIISILILYIANGEAIARSTFASLIFINILTLVLIAFYAYYASLDTDNVSVLPGLAAVDTSLIGYIRNRIASTAAFTISLLSIVVIYQAARNLSQNIPEFLVIIMALFVSLWLDTIVFFTISDLGLSIFFGNLINDFYAKTLVSVALAIPTALYLQVVRQSWKDISPTFGRPVFSILFGFQGQFTSGLREMQSELYINQQIYSYLTENIDEVIYLIDASSGELIYISPAFETITGQNVDMLENNVDNLQRIVYPEDRVQPPLLDFMLKAAPNTFRFIRADGSVGWMSNRMEEIKNQQGKVYRYLGIAQDITEEHERIERDVQLQMSEERVRLMNAFVRDASHDLKSPLSSMMLKLDLMQRTQGEKKQKLQRELQDRILYISNLIDDLFTLSMIEGEDAKRDRAVDLLEIAGSVMVDLQALAQEKALELIIQPPDSKTDCSIMSNPAAMNRLFNNLLSNAIRYTEAGRVSIQFELDEEQVCFTVSDTGIGIPEADLEKIFHRMYRSPNAKQFTKDGTGLGMAMIQSIVNNHQGTISVNSELNVGTSVKVCLPRK